MPSNTDQKPRTERTKWQRFRSMFSWRRITSKINYRKWPRYTLPLKDSLATLECCIAYNKYGGYCIPLASRHRPCTQSVMAGNVWEPETLAFMSSCGGEIIHA